MLLALGMSIAQEEGTVIVRGRTEIGVLSEANCCSGALGDKCNNTMIYSGHPDESRH